MPLPAFPTELEKKTWLKKKNKLAGDTGMGEKLDELAGVFRQINPDFFTALESAQQPIELNRLGQHADSELLKINAVAKRFRDYSLFAAKKVAELSKQTDFPKETLKLIEHMADIAESYDFELVRAAQAIRKHALERLEALKQRHAHHLQPHQGQPHQAQPHQGQPHPPHAHHREQRPPPQPSEPSGDTTLASLLSRLPMVSAETPFHFVLAVGKPSGLVLTRTAVMSIHKTEAKEMRSGQGPVLDGRCHGEAGVCIFVLDKAPPAGLARCIVRAAHTHADRKIRVKVRGGGLELDDQTDAHEVSAEIESADALHLQEPQLGDDASAARQQADFRRLAAECKESIDQLKSERRRCEGKTALRTALQTYQQHEIDRAHGQLLKLGPILQKACADDVGEATSNKQRLDELRARLAEVPDRPAVRILREAGDTLATQMSSLLDEGKLDDATMLLRRFHQDVSRELGGDNSPIGTS